jgi:Flp pilus assembly protein TadG
MAFILAPLCMLLLGIIVYGYLMSFRQNMTQAAAEGARAGAIAPPDNTPGSYTIASAQALDATNQALESFGERCDNGRMSCDINPHLCDPLGTVYCITVTVTYDYEHNPLMPDIPIVSAAIPSEFRSESTAQVNQ